MRWYCTDIFVFYYFKICSLDHSFSVVGGRMLVLSKTPVGRPSSENKISDYAYVWKSYTMADGPAINNTVFDDNYNIILCRPDEHARLSPPVYIIYIMLYRL